jgi:hypothetical protein
MAPDTRHHHRTARSRMLVTVGSSNTTTATATVPATLPTFSTTTTREVPVVPDVRDTLLAASQVAKSSDILIQRGEVFIIRKAPRPHRDSIRALGTLHNGVYDLQVPAPTTPNKGQAMYTQTCHRSPPPSITPSIMHPP